MSLGEQKAVSRRYWEDLFTEGDLSVADEIAAADWTVHNPDASHTPPGPDGMRQLVQSFRTGFPDLRFTVESVFGEGDRVVVRVTFRGTHQGTFMGIPATGRPVTIGGIGIDRFAGGKMIERWGNFDALGMLRQLGVIPG